MLRKVWRAKNWCDVTISYKLTKFKKVNFVARHVRTRVIRQKGTHQRTSLSTAAFTVKAQTALVIDRLSCVPSDRSGPLVELSQVHSLSVLMRTPDSL